MSLTSMCMSLCNLLRFCYYVCKHPPHIDTNDISTQHQPTNKVLWVGGGGWVVGFLLWGCHLRRVVIYLVCRCCFVCRVTSIVSFASMCHICRLWRCFVVLGFLYFVSLYLLLHVCNPQTQQHNDKLHK